jgi:cell cycle arrest protein BUB3
MGSGRELANPPSDGISNLRFSNHSDHLLVSSWDKVSHAAPALLLFSIPSLRPSTRNDNKP